MKSPTEYIAAVDETKRAELRKLHQLIRKTLPELKPCMVHGMIGYGPYHYRYATGREGDTARVALSAVKTGFSVHIMAVDAKGKYVAEQAKGRLGKVSVGKSCIRFKRVADLDLDAFCDVLKSVRDAVALGERNADAVSAARTDAGKGRRSAPRSSRSPAARSRAKPR